MKTGQEPASKQMNYYISGELKIRNWSITASDSRATKLASGSLTMRSRLIEVSISISKLLCGIIWLPGHRRNAVNSKVDDFVREGTIT